MIYHNVAQYLEAKNLFLNTPGRIYDGHGFYWVGDKWVSDKEFFAHNSRPRYEVAAIPNPDGKNISSGIKSKKQR